jgi:hypothetical protein
MYELGSLSLTRPLQRGVRRQVMKSRHEPLRDTGINPITEVKPAFRSLSMTAVIESEWIGLWAGTATAIYVSLGIRSVSRKYAATEPQSISTLRTSQRVPPERTVTIRLGPSSDGDCLHPERANTATENANIEVKCLDVRMSPNG